MKEIIFTLQPPLGKPVHLYKNVWEGGMLRETFNVVGGLQGDQLNGLYIASQLSRFLQGVEEGRESGYKITGKIQVFPLANMQAMQSGTRLWGLDNLDLDRAFPGNRTGDISERLCHAIHQHTTNSDYGVIVHNDFYEHHPHAQFIDKSARALAQSTGLGIAREITAPPLQLLHQWVEHGVKALLLTGGKNNEINTSQCQVLIGSCINLMLATGVLSLGERKKPKHEIQYYKAENECAIVSAHAGLFIPRVKVGEMLKQGQIIGEVRDIHGGETLAEPSAPKDGFLVSLRNHPVIFGREPLAILLTENDRPWYRPF